MAKRASGKISRKAATKRKTVTLKKVSAKKRPASKAAKATAGRATATKKTIKKTVKKLVAPRKTAAKKTAPKKKSAPTKKVATKRSPSPAKAAAKPSAVRSKATSKKATVSDRLSKRIADHKGSRKPVSSRKPQQATRSRSKVTPGIATPRKTPVTQPAPQEADNHPGMMGDGTQEQNLNQPGTSEGRITQEDVDAAFGDRDKKES